MNNNEGGHYSHEWKHAIISSHYRSGSDTYTSLHTTHVSHSGSNEAPNARDLCKNKLQKKHKS